MALSPERQDANANYPAELVYVGEHLYGTIPAGGHVFPRPDGANWLNLQILGTQATASYRGDNGIATAAIGFQIATGDTVLIPCAGTGISVAIVGGTPTYQAQWYR